MLKQQAIVANKFYLCVRSFFYKAISTINLILGPFPRTPKEDASKGDDTIEESGDQDGEKKEGEDDEENKEGTSETKEGIGNAEKDVDAPVGEQVKSGELTDEANKTKGCRNHKHC